MSRLRVSSGKSGVVYPAYEYVRRRYRAIRTRTKIRTGVRFAITSTEDYFLLYAGFVCSGAGRHKGAYASSHGFGRDSGNGITSSILWRLFDAHVSTKPYGHMSEPSFASGSTYVSLDRINNERTRKTATTTIIIIRASSNIS